MSMVILPVISIYNILNYLTMGRKLLFFIGFTMILKYKRQRELKML